MVTHLKDNLSDYLKMIIIETERDVRVELGNDPFLIDHSNQVHTGVFATLLDNIIGCTIAKSLNGFALTINLNCSYYELSIKKNYSASAEIVHQIDNIITGKGKIVDDEGIVVAEGIGTFKLVKQGGT